MTNMALKNLKTIRQQENIGKQEGRMGTLTKNRPMDCDNMKLEGIL